MQIQLTIEIPSLNEKLVSTRKTADLSQSGLAQKTQMSFQYIQKIERKGDNAVKSLPYETLLRLCEGMGVPTAAIETAKNQAVQELATAILQALDAASQKTA